MGFCVLIPFRAALIAYLTMGVLLFPNCGIVYSLKALLRTVMFAVYWMMVCVLD